MRYVSNPGRQQRSFAGYAPVPTNDENIREKKPVTITKSSPLRPFKFKSRWINYQIEGLFGKW